MRIQFKDAEDNLVPKLLEVAVTMSRTLRT